MNQKKLVAIATTYARAAASAVVALYLAGEQDPQTLVYAFVAGFLGPVLKALDPNATEFGRGAK